MITVNNLGVFDTPPAYADTTEFNNFSQIARTLQYIIPRWKNGIDLSPYTTKKIFFGSSVIEIDKTTNLTVFSGTLRNIYEYKSNLTLEATEPLVNYLEFIAETVTYSSAVTKGEVIKGNNHIQLNKLNIPLYSKIRFNNSAQEYLIVNTSDYTYEVTPAFLYSYPVNEHVTVMETTIETAANSIRRLLLLAGVPSSFIGTSFDFYHENDFNLGILFRQNLTVSDDMTLRKYLETILEMSALRIFTRAGKIEVNRIGDYHKTSPTLLDTNAMYNIKQYLNYDNLLYGYYLPYYAGGNQVKFAENYLTDVEAMKYDNRKIFKVLVDTNQSNVRILYNSYFAAQYIGELMLNYYKLPKRVIECNIKYIDPKTKNNVVIYVGDGANVYLNNELKIFQVVSLERNSKEYTLRARLQE